MSTTKKTIINCVIELYLKKYKFVNSKGRGSERNMCRQPVVRVCLLAFNRVTARALVDTRPRAFPVKMADDTVLVSLQQIKPIKIVKWKVGAGCTVPIGRVILLYDFDGVSESEQRKLKSLQAGTVHELLAPEGAVVRAG